MYKKSIIKLDYRRMRDTKRGDRGDHTTRRVCRFPKLESDSEFQAEHLDGYLGGNNVGGYLMRVREKIGDTGEPKQLIAKKQEEAAMKKIALAKLMLQANPQYGIKLSEKNLKKIEEKMLKEIKPLDINKRRMLYQMYTFRIANEDNKNSLIKEDSLTQPDSMEKESEIEESFENKSIQGISSFEKTTEGVQTDIMSMMYSTKTYTTTVPSQIPVEVAKENMQGKQAYVPNILSQKMLVNITTEPSQEKQSEVAINPSQKLPVKMVEENLQRTDTSNPPQILPMDTGKYPTQKKQGDVGNQPLQKVSDDKVKEPSQGKAETAITPSQNTPVQMAKYTWGRKQAMLNPPKQKSPVDERKYLSQKKQGDVGNQSSQQISVVMGKEAPQRKYLMQKKQGDVGNQPLPKVSIDTIKEPSQSKAEVAVVPSQNTPAEMTKGTSQKEQAEISNQSTQKLPVDIGKELSQRKQTHGKQSVTQAYVTNTASRITQENLDSQKILTDMTDQWTRKMQSEIKNQSRRIQLHATNQKHADLSQSPSRRRNASMQEQFSHKKHNDLAYSHVPIKHAGIPHPPAHNYQRKQFDKLHSPVAKKRIHSPQNSPLTKKSRSPKTFVQHTPIHKKYTAISTQKTLMANQKRKPFIKTLTITQKGHSTKIYKAVSFVDQKKASLKISMDHKSERSRAASSSRSRRSKQMSTSQGSTSSNVHSPRQIEKEDNPVKKESPSCIAKLVMNRRHKYKNRRRRARSPEMEEVPLPQTEVAKWAPQSVNEHTKPYYEAWVNTTLTAVSGDTEDVRKEKERIMEMMRERLQACLLSEDELSDEKYTGRIKVVTRR